MFQWLLKQKYRVDRGYQLLSIVNLSLILLQSDTLITQLGISKTLLVILGVPAALSMVWVLGYTLTLPSLQRSEDRMYAETTQSRRDLDEILKLLKEIRNDTTKDD